VSSGYAGINSIRLYHEIYGQGEPLVLIHGGLTTIGEMQGWVQPLAKTRRVIAVEMQGQPRAGMPEVRLGSRGLAEVYPGKSRRRGEALQ
jgi:pimeloyl-ACP methyl ester carboxylesterase